MRVTSFSTRSYDFACRSAACRPPTSGGTGGSIPGKVTAASLVKSGWTKYGKGETAQYHRGDYVINKAVGAMVGGYNVYHLKGPGEQRDSEYRSTIAGRAAKGLTSRDSLDSVVRHVEEHEGSQKKTFKVITAAEARGDSRPVSHEEFQRLAHIGQGQLDRMAADKAPTVGLDRNWTKVRAQVYAEVQQSWGGATIDAHTGHALPQGENKYAITVKSEAHSTISVHESASPEAFHAAMDRAKQEFGPLLERQSHYLGVFHDDENHRIDIDPVIVVTNRSDVDTIGAASRSIGGAYNFMDGNGYWPPHVSE